MTFFRRHPATFLIAAVSMLLSHTAFADITLQVHLGGDLAISNDTVGVLVVDRAGNGFLSPEHASAEGTVLEVGQQIGLSDDVIVAVLQSSTAEFTGGAGFMDVPEPIEYEALQLAEGMPMIFYWFPGVTTPGQPLPAMGNFESFQATAPSNLPSSIQFMLPADRGVFDLAYLAPADGGTISLTAPGGDGVHDAGATATDNTPLPSSGDSRIDPVTELPPVPGFTDIDWQSDAFGVYYGLILGPGGRIDGEITVRVAKTGALSSIIILNGKRHVYRGALELPAATLTGAAISRASTQETDLILDLALLEEVTTAGYTLSGMLDDNGTQLMIAAAHNPSRRGGPPVEEAGRYTFALPAPGSTTQTLLPAGDGVGTVIVTPTGVVRALMTLGDGTRSSETGFLSQDKTWDLYVPLYRGNGEGFLAGRVSLRDVDNIADFDSPLHWQKGAELRSGANSYYPLGFETNVNLVGSIFETPRRGAPLLVQLVDEADNATLMLEGGDLDPVIAAKTLTWDPNNRVTFDGAADNEVVRIAPSTVNGVVNGIFINRYVDGSSGATVVQRVKFSGVALQKQGIIVGNFKGNSQLTGLLTIESADMPTLTVRDGAGGVVANAGGIDFGSIGIDGGIGERIVEITNDGGGNLFVDGDPQVDDPAFGLSAVRMGFLSPGESARFRVRFDPDAEAAFAGSLTIYSNDRNNNPFVINLTGQGVAGSASDVEAGDDRSTLVGVPVAPQVPAGFNPTTFDAVNAVGNFGGNIDAVGTVSQQVGFGSIKITGDVSSGTGAFSGLLKIGTYVGRVSGAVNSDGTLTVTRYVGSLSTKYNLGSVAMLESGAGDFALVGSLAPTAAGDAVEFLFGHFTYDGNLNKTPLEGRYTMVIPANEDLGAGYPSGDGIALVSVRSHGLIIAALVMADGEKTTIRGRLTSEDIWQIYQSWRRGTVGGQIAFRDELGVSDFDGTLTWHRPADAVARNFQEGFSIVVPAIGSRFDAPAAGTRLLIGLPGGDDNAELTIDGMDPSFGDRLATWSDANVITVTPDDASERFSVRASATTGSVTAVIRRSYDDNGVLRTDVIRCAGVVFQKQDLMTGSWQSGAAAGYFGIGQPPSG